MQLKFSTLIFLLIFNIASCTIRFTHPYFLIMGKAADDKDVVISTESCLSGGFSNVDVLLTEFCVSGVWLLTDSACATADSNKYVVSGKDSCFKLDSTADIKAKRFLPLTQNMSDFEGKAFAFPNSMAYFVKLDPNNKTEMVPISQPRNEWSLLTINFGTYGRNLNEYAVAEQAAGGAGKVGNRSCYKTESAYVTQVFDMGGEGNAVFYPYKETLECLGGFDKVNQTFAVPTGRIRSLKDDQVYNSSYSYRDINYHEGDVLAAAPHDYDGPCSEEKGNHPNLSLSLPPETFPVFPHMLPPKFMEDIIQDEIQETAQRFMEFTLYKAPLPMINRTEYKYVVASTVGLAKFCCNSDIRYRDILKIRRLFRLTATYYMQYYPYEELTDALEEDRILTALGTCMNESTADLTKSDPCVYVNMTDSCPVAVNTSLYNMTYYNNTDIDATIEFELGNLDYVTELIWKAGLFVHYMCAPHFKNPSDHSAFYSKFEAFFNPLMKMKWTRPKGVHRIYELLLQDIDLKTLAYTVDTCVATAKDTSEYNRWLSRPDSITYNRVKRAAAKKEKQDANPPASGGGAGCSPTSKPKLFCVDKQFDIFDKKMAQGSPGGTCNTVVQNKAKYKYIHANTFGSTYM